jgi:hypothetical protein
VNFVSRNGKRVHEQRSADEQRTDNGHRLASELRKVRHIQIPVSKSPAANPPMQGCVHKACQIAEMAQFRRFRAVQPKFTLQSPAAAWEFSPIIGGSVLAIASHRGLP